MADMHTPAAQRGAMGFWTQVFLMMLVIVLVVVAFRWVGKDKETETAQTAPPASLGTSHTCATPLRGSHGVHLAPTEGSLHEAGVFCHPEDGMADSKFPADEYLTEEQVSELHDILTKQLGSRNPNNVVKATVEGLKQLRTVEEVAAKRGISVPEVLGLPKPTGEKAKKAAEASEGDDSAAVDTAAAGESEAPAETDAGAEKETSSDE